MLRICVETSYLRMIKCYEGYVCLLKRYNESRICMEGKQVLMKKHVMIMVSVLLTVFLAACSTRQSNSNISNSQQDTFEPSVAESQESQQEEPLIGDTEIYQLLAANLIEQYKNNTIEINDMFPAPPEGFEFPENLSDLEFSQNEMGYFVTNVVNLAGSSKKADKKHR